MKTIQTQSFIGLSLLLASASASANTDRAVDLLLENPKAVGACVSERVDSKVQVSLVYTFIKNDRSPSSPYTVPYYRMHLTVDGEEYPTYTAYSYAVEDTRLYSYTSVRVQRDPRLLKTTRNIQNVSGHSDIVAMDGSISIPVAGEWGKEIDVNLRCASRAE